MKKWIIWCFLGSTFFWTQTTLAQDTIKTLTISIPQPTTEELLDSIRVLINRNIIITTKLEVLEEKLKIIEKKGQGGINKDLYDLIARLYKIIEDKDRVITWFSGQIPALRRQIAKLRAETQKMKGEVLRLKGDSILVALEHRREVKRLQSEINDLSASLRNNQEIIKSLREQLFQASFKVLAHAWYKKKEVIYHLETNHGIKIRRRRINKIEVNFQEGPDSYLPTYHFKLTNSKGKFIREGDFPNENENGAVSYVTWKRSGTRKNRLNLPKGTYILKITYNEGNQVKIKKKITFEL